MSWIAEKAAILSAGELGQDVADAEALKRNHEALLGDLIPIEEKVGEYWRLL